MHTVVFVKQSHKTSIRIIANILIPIFSKELIKILNASTIAIKLGSTFLWRLKIINSLRNFIVIEKELKPYVMLAYEPVAKTQFIFFVQGSFIMENCHVIELLNLNVF